MLKISKILFITALLAVAFSYGVVCHWKKIFPYKIIEEAYIAYQALVDLYSDEEKSHIPFISFWEKKGVAGPKASKLSHKVNDEKIFFLGNERALLDLCPDVGCLAWIADREGNIIHVWKNNPDLWLPLSNRETIKDKWYIYPVGAYLYPNGDILVSYQGRNVFPIPMGLAKFDKDSNLIWKRNDYYHHWFSVDDSGQIYIPGSKVVDSPLHINDRKKYFSCDKAKFVIDTIAILDANGRLVREIDTLKAFNDSDLIGVFNNDGKSHDEINTCDPLHLNDVRILTLEMAQQYPGFEPGDLLLSFRSLNGIGILDPDTNLFKWFYVGAVHNQHSPRFSGQNRILAFDNLGGRKEIGTSRVIEVEISNGNTRSLYPQPTSNIPSEPFDSKTAGHIDVHPNRNRMLVSWTHQGKVWEIDINNGHVLWEYVNTHLVKGAYGRVPIYTALYITKPLNFTFNGGKLP